VTLVTHLTPCRRGGFSCGEPTVACEDRL
jgi:hypothetical protein